MIGRHDGSDPRAGQLLSLLARARDAETGQPMSERQLRDEVLTLVLAGHETTGNSLAFTLMLLAQHPELQDAIAEDCVSALGSRRAGFEDLPQLASVTRAFEETLRLYPPGWLLGRTAIADDTVCGIPIPTGHTVNLVPYVMHRHPDYWEAPDRFDPDRFTRARSATRHKYAYVPFGAGQRVCIGQSFALTEATLVLARLLQRYRFTLHQGKLAEPEPYLTLRPKEGVWLCLSPR
jgi:cytochrome P450